MGEKEQGDDWGKWEKRIRDSLLYVVGLAGIVNELFLVSDPRPAALVFLAALTGVPLVLRADEVRRNNGSGDDK